MNYLLLLCAIILLPDFFFINAQNQTNLIPMVTNTFNLYDITGDSSKHPLLSNSDGTLIPHITSISPPTNSSKVFSYFLYNQKDSVAQIASWDMSVRLAPPDVQKKSPFERPVVNGAVFEKLQTNLAYPPGLSCTWSRGFRAPYFLRTTDGEEKTNQTTTTDVYNIEVLNSRIEHPGDNCNRDHFSVTHFVFDYETGSPAHPPTIMYPTQALETAEVCGSPQNGIYFSDDDGDQQQPFFILLCLPYQHAPGPVNNVSFSLLRCDRTMKFSGYQYVSSSEDAISSTSIVGNNNDHGNRNHNRNNDNNHQNSDLLLVYIVTNKKVSNFPGRFTIVRFNAKTLESHGNITFDTNLIQQRVIGLAFDFPYVAILFQKQASVFRFNVDLDWMMSTSASQEQQSELAPTILSTGVGNIQCHAFVSGHDFGCPFTALKNFIFFAIDQGQTSSSPQLAVARYDFTQGGKLSNTIMLSALWEKFEVMYRWEFFIGGNRILYALNHGSSPLGTRWSGLYRVDSGVVIELVNRNASTTTTSTSISSVLPTPPPPLSSTTLTTTTTTIFSSSTTTEAPPSSPPAPGAMSFVGEPYELSKDATVLAFGLLVGVQNQYSFSAQRGITPQLCDASPFELTVKLFGDLDPAGQTGSTAMWDFSSHDPSGFSPQTSDIFPAENHMRGKQYGEYFYLHSFPPQFTNFENSTIGRVDGVGNFYVLAHKKKAVNVVGFAEKYILFVSGDFRGEHVIDVYTNTKIYMYSLDLQNELASFDLTSYMANHYRMNVTHPLRFAESDQSRFVYFFVGMKPLATVDDDDSEVAYILQFEIKVFKESLLVPPIISLVSMKQINGYSGIGSMTASGFYMDQSSLDPSTGLYNAQYLFLFINDASISANVIVAYKVTSDEDFKIENVKGQVTPLTEEFPYCDFYGHGDYQAGCPISQIPYTPYFVGSMKQTSPLNYFRVQRINALTGETTSPLQIDKKLFGTFGTISPATSVVDSCGNFYFVAAMFEPVIRQSKVVKIDTGIRPPSLPKITEIISQVSTTTTSTSSSSTSSPTSTETSLLTSSSSSPTTTTFSTTTTTSPTTSSSTTSSTPSTTSSTTSSSTTTTSLTSTTTAQPTQSPGHHNNNHHGASNSSNDGNNTNNLQKYEIVGAAGGGVLVIIIVALCIYARSRRIWCFKEQVYDPRNNKRINANDRFNDYDQALRSEVGDYDVEDGIESQHSLAGSTLSNGSPGSFFNRVARDAASKKHHQNHQQGSSTSAGNYPSSSSYESPSVPPPPGSSSSPGGVRRHNSSSSAKSLKSPSVSGRGRGRGGGSGRGRSMRGGFGESVTGITRDAADVDKDDAERVLNEPLMLEDSVETFRSEGSSSDDDDEQQKRSGIPNNSSAKQLPSRGTSSSTNKNNNTSTTMMLNKKNSSRRRVQIKTPRKDQTQQQQHEEIAAAAAKFSPREEGEGDENRSSTEPRKNPDHQMLINFGFPPEAIFEPEDIEISQQSLGSGGTATVYNGRFAKEENAIKFGCPNLAIKRFRERPDSLQKALREILRSYKLHHPHIVRCIGLVISRSPVFIDLLMIMEKGENTLQDLLENTSSSKEKSGEGNNLLDIPTCLNYAKQIAAGLSFLHTSKPMIVHADIKPGNIIMFNNNTHLKLIDFGFAKETDKSKTDASQYFFGTMKFMAPECTFSVEMRPTTDVYSFGVILFWLFSGKEPYPRATLRQITSGKLVETFEPRDDAPEEVVIMTKECLSTRPEARPKNGAELLERLELVKNNKMNE